MSRLVDLIVQEAKQLGIETLPPKKIESLKRSWAGRWKKYGKILSGYEGYYQISNKGKVKSLSRLIKAKNNFVTKERILKNQDNSRGYLRVELKVDNKKQKFFIHRLVAEHFIDKPEGCNVVNHLDCNPHNNNVENLEWTTLKGNTRYMQKLGRDKRTFTWIKKLTKTQRKVNGKKVQGISINGTKILNYEAVNEVKIDGFQPSCVSCCCNGKRLTHKGYVWRFI